MKKQDAQKRIQKLMQEIRHHSDLYHKHDRPEISDEAYDSLWQELVSLEQAFPDLKDALSPTVRIGDKVLDGFEKSIHLFPQWSFDNIFDWKGLQDWEKKIKRFIEKDSVLEHEILDYIVELKIDGLKVILDYENGRFVRGSTRGDGTVGENITENLKTIHDIALVVPEKRNFSVVGEAWIEKTALVDINTQRALSDLPPYANPRNLAAGTLRQLDTSVVARRNLKTFVYDFDSNDISFQTHHDELMFLKKSGFHVNNEYLHTDTIADIQKFYESWVEKRHNQEYGIDGMVIKINNNAICKALGYTAKAPRFAVAYKFPAEQKTTRVLDIVTQIGRSGVLTPVAHLEPVLIDGSMVSRATLHNADEIARLDVRIGDTVIVEKAGDIIPKIKSVLKNMRDDYSAPFSLQDYFSKNNITAYAETSNAGVLSWYIDPDTSSEIAIMSLSYFCSKKALNIEGMGEKNVRALYDAGFIKNFSDIYSVSYDQVISLPLFKERATQNLLDAVEKSKKTRFAQLLTGIGIRHVGEEVADIYAKNITPDQFLHIDYETFVALHSIGEKIAQSTVDWADQEKNQIEFKKLLDIFTFAETENTSGVFAGKIFVVTGTLKQYSRDEVKQIIKDNGGKVSSQVSSKTDYVLAGEKAGSKLEKAKNLGVTVLSEGQFVEMM